ncbi:MAG: transcriptional regulator [Planctomycetota bacterium]
MKKAPKQNREGRYAYEGLDRVIHEKARLGLLTCLAGADGGLTFGELKRLCDLTDGNLNRHLKQLADAELVLLSRDETKSRPQTICELTDAGRQRFVDYLSELQRVVADANTQMRTPKTASRRATNRLATGGE